MEKKLEQLLLGKKFHQLTAEEKYYVTESIGEEEYGRMHLLLNKSKKAFKKPPSINPDIKSNLLLAMRKQHNKQVEQKPPAIVRMMRYRMPAWQAAAAIALLIGLHFWLQSEPQVIEKIDTVYVHSTDTIYKEMAMPAPVVETPTTMSPVRINVKPKAQEQDLPAEAEIVAAVDSSARNYELTQVPDSFNVLVSQPRGQSVTQSADLWKLLEEVY